MTDKQLVINSLSQMPDTATLADIQENIKFLEAIREAEEDILAGRVVSHEEVKQKFKEWISI